MNLLTFVVGLALGVVLVKKLKRDPIEQPFIRIG